MKVLSLFVAALLALSQIGSAQSGNAEADAAAVKMFYEHVVNVVKANDADGFVALFTDDAVVLRPDRPPMVGKESFEAFLRRIFERNSVEVNSAKLEEAVVAGNWAFARDTVVDTFTPKDGGKSRQNNYKHLLILRRQPDGSWKIARMMWNSNV